MVSCEVFKTLASWEILSERSALQLLHPLPPVVTSSGGTLTCTTNILLTGVIKISAEALTLTELQMRFTLIQSSWWREQHHLLTHLCDEQVESGGFRSPEALYSSACLGFTGAAVSLTWDAWRWISADIRFVHALILADYDSDISAYLTSHLQWI